MIFVLQVVGMAATLAGVCQVPLTSVLLLFELTRDYRIVLPLLGAVGLSSWIASNQERKSDAGQVDASKVDSYRNSSSTVFAEESKTSDLCELESSVCVHETDREIDNLVEKLTVAEAMRTRYVTVRMHTSIIEAVTLMLEEKQSCAVIVNSGGIPIGLLVLEDVQDVGRFAKSQGMEVDKILVSHICNSRKDVCQVWTVTPSMTLLTAEKIMDSHGTDRLPVVSEHDGGGRKRGRLIGLLDRECISITVRAIATKEFLSLQSVIQRPDS